MGWVHPPVVGTPAVAREPVSAAAPRRQPATDDRRARAFDVVVVGSANVDRVLRVRELPRPGETIASQDVRVMPGGKGANQAVAAARQGASVAFVGAVGDDQDGVWLRSVLQAEGVDTTHLEVVTGATGQAFILVNAAGENCITVSLGANERLAAEHVERASSVIADALVVLTQFEVPVDTVTHALATATGVRILNPAPATPISQELQALVDILVPNMGELGALAGETPDDIPAAAASAKKLQIRDVVVTMGADGALIVGGDVQIHVPAMDVDAVDTTGAGDTFCGVLATSLAADQELPTAVRRATRAAALSATQHGAQTAMPTVAQTDRPHL